MSFRRSRILVSPVPVPAVAALPKPTPVSATLTASLLAVSNKPTFEPNITRRGARPVYVPLRQETQFRPDLGAIEKFVKSEPRARGIFLNFPHNPTGGVATRDDLKTIANIVRGTNVAVFSDEPYNHMVWSGRHVPLFSQPGLLDQAVACYAFSKSYSMSGWRLGYAISGPRIIDAIGKMINTSLSCVTPIAQFAGAAGDGGAVRLPHPAVDVTAWRVTVRALQEEGPSTVG